MSENQLFCWSNNFADKDSYQQKRYRIFNKEVSKERFNEVKLIIDKIIPIENNNLKDIYLNLSNEQIQKIMKIDEFDKTGFEFITNRKIENNINLHGKKVEVIVDGKKFTATID